MYKFGNESNEVLEKVNKYLVLTANLTISMSAIDISIAEWGGLRTAKYQKSLFNKGWSKADGTNTISNHQKTDEEGKSMALDLCAYHKSKQNWNAERLVYMAGLMLCNFEKLKDEGKIPQDLYLHWGGLWRSKLGGMGWDLPHFELRTSKQIPTI